VFSAHLLLIFHRFATKRFGFLPLFLAGSTATVSASTSSALFFLPLEANPAK